MINKIKKVSLKDLFGIFKFLIVLIPSIFYKIYLCVNKKQLWLICEIQDTARDNGYAFYKYIRENKKDIISYYAIDFKSSDYKNVKNFGNIVQWSSLKHYFLYMSATRNISSHKEGNPNHTLFTVLHLYLNLYNNRVFLQHGITKDNMPMFYYKNTKFKYFICGAKREYDYINKKFGYPNGHVVYTGFARFDNLKHEPDENIILFIPTWRRWLDNNNIYDSNYYKKILEFINSKELNDILEKNNKYLYFYPHFHLQKYISEDNIKNSRVLLKNINNSNIQEILIKGSLLITDYSSVYFDFAYMNKPVLYFQHDYDEYRSKHMLEGYFRYQEDGFGPICNSIEELNTEIEKYINNNYKVDSKYEERINKFFTTIDNNNSERIYQAIK